MSLFQRARYPATGDADGPQPVCEPKTTRDGHRSSDTAPPGSRRRSLNFSQRPLPLCPPDPSRCYLVRKLSGEGTWGAATPGEDLLCAP